MSHAKFINPKVYRNIKETTFNRKNKDKQFDNIGLITDNLFQSISKTPNRLKQGYTNPWRKHKIKTQGKK